MPHLKEGLIIIDGGNSFYRDSVRHYTDLKNDQLSILTVELRVDSYGREIGFWLMVGWRYRCLRSVKRIFAAVATADGYRRVGPSGAGHYVKWYTMALNMDWLEAYA